MRKYIIERTVPGAGQMDTASLAALAATSNTVIAELGPAVQWVHSYVVDDRIVCIYVTQSEELVREHARRGGFPADTVDEIRTVIDPTTSDLSPR